MGSIKTKKSDRMVDAMYRSYNEIKADMVEESQGIHNLSQVDRAFLLGMEFAIKLAEIERKRG
jgi:hypothetical protein